MYEKRKTSLGTFQPFHFHSAYVRLGERELSTLLFSRGYLGRVNELNGENRGVTTYTDFLFGRGPLRIIPQGIVSCMHHH